MDLPQLIAGQNNKTASREGASRLMEGAITSDHSGVEAENPQTISTPIGQLTRRHTVELNKAHPSAISGRQNISHQSPEVEHEEEPITKIPVGLYRLALDDYSGGSVSSESNSEDVSREDSESSGTSSDRPLTPETFLSGIGDEKPPEQVDVAKTYPETAIGSAETVGVEGSLNSTPEHSNTTQSHEIPIQPDHTHFQKNQHISEGQAMEPAPSISPNEAKGNDDAQMLARMQSEREQAQVELGVQ